LSSVTFDDIASLVDGGTDRFIGRGPQYRGGVLFGGQAVAQALIAAARTVGPGRAIHSLHAYFIRPGAADEPTTYQVHRLRDGRTFAARTVVASQSGGTILHLTASFHSLETAEAQPSRRRPPMPGPQAIADSSWSTAFDHRLVVAQDGHAVAWLRAPAADPDDATLAAAALALLSDCQPIGSVRSKQHALDGSTAVRWDGISLDHTIWFHRPVPAGEWQLHDFRCDVLGLPQGLSQGQVFTEDGTLLATVTQQLLLVNRNATH
jgi:acyl-CoA thioesterase-2